MRPLSFHRPNNCYEMGEIGTVRLHAEKYGSPRHLTTGIVPRHHIIDSTEFAGISNFYGFAVTKGALIGRVFYRFTHN